MLRWFYIQLLRAHPAEFRYRFCDGMLEAFDYAHESTARLQMLLDAVVSLGRQWFLRPEYRQPWQSSNAEGPVYELLTFQQIEPYQPRGIALAEGGMLALLLLVGVVNAINYGGGKLHTYLIGMHRPGFGLVKVDRASMESGKLDTTVEKGRDMDDPWRPFARSYFRVVRVLWALDVDGNLTISSMEIANAAAALRRLDLNHDGKLSAEECGFLANADTDGSLDRRLDFMSANPVLAALDSNHDGEISDAEIANSPIALLTLDLDHDGTLTPYELIPPRALSEAAAMMTRLDINDSGVIAVQEVTDENAGSASVKRILAAADRNRDGLVTRGELIVELAMSTPAPVQIPRTFQ